MICYISSDSYILDITQSGWDTQNLQLENSCEFSVDYGLQKNLYNGEKLEMKHTVLLKTFLIFLRPL